MDRINNNSLNNIKSKYILKHIFDKKNYKNNKKFQKNKYRN